MGTKTNRTILLIDDDKSLLVTLSDFLKFEGYDVVTAESGEKGLERLKKLTPDLIILDMSMPGMGGVGFLKRISSDDGKPEHPVLVLTARANMAEFFANVDVDGFIAKPCDPNDLLMEVGRILFLRGKDGGAPEEAGGEEEARGVLIGEDDSILLDALLPAFRRAGYDVSTASEGPQVLEAAITQRPDVIVMKRVLSNMNGDAVANVLKEMPNTKDIPVVLYDDGASADLAAALSAPGTGVNKFVASTKVAALLDAVGQVLAG